LELGWLWVRGTRRNSDARAATLQNRMYSVLAGLQVIISVVLILLILMHSGKDSGLSGAFGAGSGGGPFGGGSLVERNLNRWTIFFAVLFVVNVIILLKIG
jgi:preprotein translocase subunit SecG